MLGEQAAGQQVPVGGQQDCVHGVVGVVSGKKAWLIEAQTAW